MPVKMQLLAVAFALGLAAVLVTVAGTGSASAGSEPRTLTVTGSAVVAADPDQASFDATVSVVASTATSARTQASTALVAVIGAVTDAGVSMDDLQTIGITLFEEREFRNDDFVRVGFRFSNTIRHDH